MGLGRACGSALHSIYPVRVRIGRVRSRQQHPRGAARPLFDDAIAYYEAREQEWGEELPRNLERWIVLQVLDTRWREHLDNMDYMRQGIGLRGYAQKDPLVEYRAEGHAMFDEMNFLIKQETVRALMHAEVEVEDEAQYDHSPIAARAASHEHDAGATLEALAAARPAATATRPRKTLMPVVEQRQLDPERDVGRNDPCWCGQGKKYKRCHGA